MPTSNLPPLTQDPAWKALQAHGKSLAGLHLRELFARDPGRGERLTAEGAGLFLDYSKQRVTDETIRLLAALAAARDLPGRREAMFTGEKINATEQRAVLHVALRAPRGARRATWSTARPSVALIFSPVNMASRRAGRPRASARATSSRTVSSVTRCLA